LTETDTLRLRVAELIRLRDDYRAEGKGHIVAFLDRLIDDARNTLAHAERDRDA